MKKYYFAIFTLSLLFGCASSSSSILKNTIETRDLANASVKAYIGGQKMGWINKKIKKDTKNIYNISTNQMEKYSQQYIEAIKNEPIDIQTKKIQLLQKEKAKLLKLPY